MQITDEDIDAGRKLNQKIGNNPRVDKIMLPLTEGLTLVRSYESLGTATQRMTVT